LLTSRVNTHKPPVNFTLFPQRPCTAPEFQSIENINEIGELPLITPDLEGVHLIQRPPTTMQIVESPTSFMVNTARGLQRIPRLHWLVLEPPDSEDVDGFAGRRLAEELGGGSIPHDGAQLLRLVPEGRLHAVAAEANFKRASRGASFLALQHAAYAAELLSERDREVETGAMSVSLESCLCSSMRKDIDHAARLKRVTSIVREAAVAAQGRPKYGEKLEFKPIEKKTQDRLLKSHSLLHKGVQCLEEFHTFISRRFGNAVRAWFALDPEENMQMGERLFLRRVLEIGFRGNVSAMYKYVDSDRSGSISILELDSNAAMLLAVFKKFVTEHFQGCPEKCFTYMDHKRIGRLSKDDVVLSLGKLNFEGICKEELFDLLDREGLGFVVPRDLKFLKKWQPVAYLFVQPSEELMRNIKEGFQVAHGSLWRTWRLALDADCTMRVSWGEFLTACKKLWRAFAAKSVALPVTLPTTEEHIAAAWRAMDFDCSGWIPLKMFDPAAYKGLKNFKSWAQNTYGSCVEAIRALDVKNDGKLSIWELRKSDTRPGAYPGDVDRLFEYLDWDKQRSIGENEVKFLDDWDIAWEEYEEHSKGRRQTAR
jgi:hypothetical protein